MEGEKTKFDRKYYNDLLETSVPKCHGHKMVESINEAFGLMEEKMTRMLRVMTALVCKSEESTGLHTDNTISQFASDCASMKSLMEVQKEKIDSLKRKHSRVDVPEVEVKKEKQALRDLFYGRVKYPSTPYRRPDRKKTGEDVKIGGIYLSSYLDFLLYPAPIFKLSAYMQKALTPPTSIKPEHINGLLQRLAGEGIIFLLFSPFDPENCIIMKELRLNFASVPLQKYGLSFHDYIIASCPMSLKELQLTIDNLDEFTLNTIRNDHSALVRTMVVAAVVTSPREYIFTVDFPQKVPIAVRDALEVLERNQIIRMVAGTPSSSSHYLKLPSCGATRFFEKSVLG